MPSYLLDSDVLIWVLRGRPETVELVARLQSESEELISCSALSVLEIWVGARPSEQERTQTLLDSFHVRAVDGRVARRGAELLASRGHGRDPRQWVDGLIAATCLEHGLILVTYNRRDYPYEGISLHGTA